MGLAKHMLCTLVTALLCTVYCRAQSLKYDVSEEQNIGTFVANVSNTSYPQKLKSVFKGLIQFTFQDRSQTAFQMNETTGVLRTNEVLDRETLSLPEDTFTLKIVCTVSSVSAVIPIEVKLLDINDNNPRFPQDVEDIFISEAAASNVAEFVIDGARDADTGNYSTQGYEITARNDDGAFGLRIKHPSPEITKVVLVVLKKLDRERNDSYLLTIQAKDGGNPPRIGVKVLNITVLDANDNSPQFSKDYYVGRVNENEAKGSFILNVSATDLDLGTNAEIRYSLEQRPEYKDLFSLNNITGELKTSSELDYEKSPEYVLEVIAEDQGSDAIKSTAVVKVKVLDENDNTPTITVRALAEAVDSQNRLPEDVSVGSGVALVVVRDDDSGLNGKVSVTLHRHESDFALREILAGQYILEVKQPLNLDKFSQYDLLFKAQDHGVPPRRVNQSFVIRLADSNRHAPRFKSSLYRVEVPDDSAPGSVVSTPTAIDMDYGRNARLTYSVQSVQMTGRDATGLGKASDWFGFDTKTGQLRLMKPLWCAFTPAFMLHIGVRDDGRVPRTATTAVNVTVTCRKNVQHFSVPENQPIGAYVGKVILTPIVPNKQLSIRLLPQEQENFEIHNTTGIITTTRTLDRESISFYEVKGVISDGQLQMPVTLNIRVLDENDNAPVFVDINNNQLIHISGSAQVKERVFKVKAIDIDYGKNGVIKYFIEEGNEDGSFAVDEDSGELLKVGAFSRSSYELLLRAVDQGDIKREVFIRIQLKIKAVITPPSSTTRPGFGTSSTEGFLSDIKVIIIVGVCSLLLLLVVVIVIIVVARRRNRKKEIQSVEVAVLPEEKRYSGHEISREEAINVTKKLYSNATDNYYQNPTALQKAKKISNSQSVPLLQAKPSMDSLRMAGAPAKERSSNVFYAGAPKDSSHSEDDLDSGRGGSTSESSPPTTRNPQERIPPSGHSGDPVRTRAHAHAANGHGHRREQRSRGPVVNLPLRDSPGGSQTVVTLPGITHSTTDL